MDLDKIYKYRFRNVNAVKKNIVWQEISQYLIGSGYLNYPVSILDPAGGNCEFINTFSAEEKWAIDIKEDFISKYAIPEVKIVIGNNLQNDLPVDYFDAVFISNFLEHLNNQEEVASLLSKMFKVLRKGGRIIVMGPNFKYAYKEYFDFADHQVVLSELAVAEHLVGAGFDILKIVPRFLPLSFRSGGLLPVSHLTVKAYLNFPLAWRFIGKQFLVVAQK